MNITVVAFLMIAAVIAAVFFKRVPMQFVLCIVPIICCVLLGYSFAETGDFIIGSINNAMKAAGYMCLFAMIYFTMLGKTGMFPLYKKMKFDRMAAMIIAQTSIAAMCFVPWGIAVVNSSVFAGVDAMELSRRLMPVAVCFIPVIALQWIYFGIQHKKQGGPMQIQWEDGDHEQNGEGKDDALLRPGLFWFNLILFVGVITLLSLNIMLLS